MIHHIEKGQIVEEVIKAEKLVVIDFFATWCVPCQEMSIVLHDVEKEYEDKIEVYKVDVDESQDIAMRYGVTAMPTLVFFRDGQEIERNVGYMDKEEFIDLIEELMK